MQVMQQLHKSTGDAGPSLSTLKMPMKSLPLLHHEIL